MDNVTLAADASSLSIHMLYFWMERMLPGIVNNQCDAVWRRTTDRENSNSVASTTSSPALSYLI